MVAAIARFRLQYSPRPRSGGGRGAGCEPRRARNAERRTGAATQRQDRERGAHSAGDESRAGGLGRRDRAPDPPAHPTRSLRAHRSSVDSTDYFHQLRYDTRLSNSTAHLRHTLYAWAPPSPRVRLHEAYLTYLLTPGSVSPLPSATQTRTTSLSPLPVPLCHRLVQYHQPKLRVRLPNEASGLARHMHMPPRLPPSSPRPSYPASPALHFSRTYLTHGP